ncbi:hypothetical protein [Shewanella sp. SR44-3]|uniref:hypothetical protein n=1 Tax=unclassified Shewanella TaxID=196818 RepID=UPI0015F84E25|nr:hypothetical protein [Shewanella sp. SR44-3]MBB1269645.1 hypothetical protein [Shewanella sp. SR44-3]
MHSQQKAESDLLSVYRRMITLILLLMIFGVLAWGYFSSVSQLKSQSLAIEHSRLINTLPMIRSQWLSSGRPSKMKLQWQGQDTDNSPQAVMVFMSHAGWPQLNSQDSLGCQLLWQQLLGSDLVQLNVNTEYQLVSQRCEFIALDGAKLTYQPMTGEVTFWQFGDK